MTATVAQFCHFESLGMGKCPQQCKQCGEGPGKESANHPAPSVHQIIDAIRSVCAERDRALEQNRELVATLEAALAKAKA